MGAKVVVVEGDLVVGKGFEVGSKEWGVVTKEGFG